nr:trans-cinnamate 4-monooxygenase [Tanacetum cinerariifolium]
MDHLFLEKTLIASLTAIILAIIVSKLRGKKFKLPPGPIPVPVFGNWLQVGGDLNHRTMSDLAKKYGEICSFRMGERNLVVVSSQELAKEVLHTQGVEFGSRVRNLVFEIFTGKGQDMIFADHGEHWRTMRRIMTPPFFTHKVVQQYRYGWEDEAGKVVEDARNNVEASTKGIVIRNRKLLSTKKVDKNQSKCAMDHIHEAKDKGEISDNNVLYIVEDVNVAALETTLWSMEWGIAELVNHPEIQAKLRHELDTKLGPGVQITEPDVQNLPYLQAVIKETLRLRMAAPFLVPHMNLHDAKLSGFDIPAKSRILVNTWWLANNPEQWKKPEEFRPERFLEEEAKVETNGNDFRYLPFGFGRRSCPGMILALPIMGITLGRLVQNFELLPPPGQSKIDTNANGAVWFTTRNVNRYGFDTKMLPKIGTGIGPGGSLKFLPRSLETMIAKIMAVNEAIKVFSKK